MTDETEKRPDAAEPAPPAPSPGPKGTESKKRAQPPPPPITDEQRAEILRLSSEVRWGQRQIARRLGLSRSQVRTVVERARPADPKRTAAKKEEDRSASLLDPFRLSIAERVEKGITTSRILREIQKEGYQGGRTILADHVRSIRPKRVARREQPKIRFETRPAQEAQSDFGTYRVKIGGVETVVHAFLSELAFSRKASVEVCRDQRRSSVFQAIDLAARDFEGCPHDWVIDNMSAIVLGRTEPEPGKREPLLHPDAIAFQEHYGFKFRPCRPRHPDRKGKDENFVGYFERDCLRGLAFESWEDLRRHVRQWCANTANKRKHGTTGRVPDEAWLDEKDLLVRLPEARFAVHRAEPRAVGPDSTLSIGGTLYSVPAVLANETVTVRLYLHHFEVVDRAGKIAFSRGYVDPKDKGRLQLDPTHYSSLQRRRGERGRARRLDESFRMRFPTLGPLVDGIARHMKSLAHVHLAALLRLADRYGQDAFLSAALRVQAAKRYDSLAVERLLEREHPLVEGDMPPLAVIGGTGAVLLDDVDEGSLDRFAALDGEGGEEAPDHGA